MTTERAPISSDLLLAAIAHAQALFIENDDTEGVFAGVLSELMALTGATCGFIGEVLLDDSQTPSLNIHAVVTTTTQAFPSDVENGMKDSMPSSRGESRVADLLRRKKTLIDNNVDAAVPQCGMPFGCRSLTSFFGVPVFYAGRMNALFVLGNCPDGFAAAWVAQLLPLTQTIGLLVEMQRQRVALEEIELASAAVGIGTWEYRFSGRRLRWSARAAQLWALGESEGSSTPARALRRLGAAGGRRLLRLLQTQINAQCATLKTEIELIGGDQRAHELQLLARVHYSVSGEPVDMVGVILDVTEDRRIRRELQCHQSGLEALVREQTHVALAARDQAREASRIKSEFLASVSHELRTPLHSVIGFAQLLIDDDHTNDPQTVQRHVKRIASSARRQLKLVDDLLDIVRLETGQISLRREWQPLQPLLLACMDELQPMFLASAVTLELHAPANLQAAVDAERFGQIVRNLLANALKFSPRNNRVEIRAVAVSPSTIEISIRDHGLGIPEAELALIFDRFRQGTNATGTRGVGLGLAISREFVVLHGGQLRVCNHIEGGAEFSFSIVAPTAPSGELPCDEPSDSD